MVKEREIMEEKKNEGALVDILPREVARERCTFQAARRPKAFQGFEADRDLEIVDGEKRTLAKTGEIVLIPVSPNDDVVVIKKNRFEESFDTISPMPFAQEFVLHAVRKQPGTLDSHGLEVIALSFCRKGNKTPLQTFHVFSGAPGRQVFSKGGTGERAGTLYPCPQGKYRVRDIDWAGGKDNWNANHGPGLGPIFIPFDPLFRTARGAFGIHFDENHAGSPGSAGCLVFETLSNLKSFVETLRKYDPQEMTVDWGLA